MTTISSVVDALETIVSSALPDWSRLPNPYQTEANNKLVMAKAFGIAVGDGQPQRLELNNYGNVRQFAVILVNQVFATEHDIEGRVAVDKELLEAYSTLRRAVELSQTLGLNGVINTTYQSDTGLGFMSGADGLQFMVISIGFSVLYKETLS
jgi:hypothetical protein